MQLRYPFGFDDQGGTAQTDHDAHIRQMIEQMLFTNPGERLNRPDFGSGLRRLVHSPNSEVLAAALQANVQGSLQRWLGDVLDVRSVEVTSQEEKLIVLVSYAVTRTRELRTERFERSVS